MQRAFALLLFFLLLACPDGPFSWAGTVQARETRTFAGIPFSALPREAQETLFLIQHDGPFPYPRKDGRVFGNLEQHLPQKPHGYYKEYTVRTPESVDRGPRRIVAGLGKTGDVATSGEYYYTDNHYRTFARIREIP